MGKVRGHLYVLDTKSFSVEAISAGCNMLSSACTVIKKCLVNNVSLTTWHQRMGHPYEKALQHLPFYDNKSEFPANYYVSIFQANKIAISH